jgi:hypothetical protein
VPGAGVDAAGDVLHRLAHQQAGDVGGVLDHLDAAPDIALGVLEGLAQLLADDLGQLVVVLLEQVLIVQHQPRALRHRHFLPGLERRLGRGHRARQLGRGGLGHFAQHFLVGRVDHRGEPGAFALHPVAVDEQGNASGKSHG